MRLHLVHKLKMTRICQDSAKGGEKEGAGLPFPLPQSPSLPTWLNVTQGAASRATSCSFLLLGGHWLDENVWERVCVGECVCVAYDTWALHNPLSPLLPPSLVPSRLQPLEWQTAFSHCARGNSTNSAKSIFPPLKENSRLAGGEVSEQVGDGARGMGRG